MMEMTWNNLYERVFNMREHFINKYISYRVEKESVRHESVCRLSQDDKEEICMEISKKTRLMTLIFGLIIFMPAWFFFIRHMFMTQEENPFARWLVDTMNGINAGIQGSWGHGMTGKRALIFRLFFRALPIIAMIAVPVVSFMLITVNILLKRKIKSISDTGM